MNDCMMPGILGEGDWDEKLQRIEDTLLLGQRRVSRQVCCTFWGKRRPKRAPTKLRQ